MTPETIARARTEPFRAGVRPLVIVALLFALPVLHLAVVGNSKVNLCAADPIVALGSVWILWNYLFGKLRLPLLVLFSFAAAISVLSIVMNAPIALPAKGVIGIFIAVLKALFPWAYFFFAVSLLRDRRDLRLLVQAWIAASGVVALTGIVGAISYQVTGTENAFAMQYRAHGTLGDANFFSMHLGVSFLLSLFHRALAGRTPAWLVLIMALQLTGIILSASRSGLLAFLMALAIVLISTSSARTKLAAFACLTGCLLLFGLVPAGSELIASNPFTARLATTTLDVRETDRKGLWELAWNNFLESPVIGVGYENGPLANRGRAGEKVGEAHNTYLGIASEMGVTGLLIYSAVILYFPVVLLRQWLATRPAARTRVNWYLIAAFLNITILGLAVNVENYRGLWLVMAIAYWHLSLRPGLNEQSMPAA